MKKIFWTVRLIEMLITGVWVGLSSCGDHSAGDKVIIAGVLSTSYHPDIAIVKLSDTTSPAARVVVAYFKQSFIDGAAVTVSTDSQSVQLTPKWYVNPLLGDSELCYDDVRRELLVTAGKTYRLDVEIPDGRKFRAFTTVLMDPIFLTGSLGDTVTVDVRENYSGGYNGYRFLPMWHDPRGFVKLNINQSSTSNFVAHTYYVSPFDSCLITFPSGQDIVRRDRHVFTLDSAYSQYSYRVATYPFGVDSLYDVMYGKWALNPDWVYSNIQGENVVGCFGSYGHAYTYFYARKAP